MSKVILNICGKTSDLFSANLVVDGETVKTHDGYVPDFMPGQHWGDYVEMSIDIETGQILNWTKPSLDEVKEQLNGE